ncbi:MAG: SIS domain-containing protein [Hyphomonadaceae bacterium]|nr:SIS domain-containing protein [Hyphomonadaceae bacterium]
MDKRSTLMETEARESPSVAARLVERATPRLRELGERLRLLSPRYAVAAGRGSSDAAALLAKYLFEARLGLPTVSAAPSIRSIYGRQLNIEKALVLAISQSGRSPDLVEFCRSATGPDVLRVGMINDEASPLADIMDVLLSLEAGPEKSVAATKSCIAAMTLVFGLTAHWRNDQVMIAAFERAPDVLAAALVEDWSAAEAFFDGDGPIYVIGRGPGLAVAAEAALKLKETNGLHAEAVSAAEVRHGPFALVGPALRVVIFAQRDAAFDGLSKLAGDLEALGSAVLLVSSETAHGQAMVKPDAEPVLELLAMLARFYVLASATALKRGRSPDHPPMLTKITETR